MVLVELLDGMKIADFAGIVLAERNIADGHAVEGRIAVEVLDTVDHSCPALHTAVAVNRYLLGGYYRRC